MLAVVAGFSAGARADYMGGLGPAQGFGEFVFGNSTRTNSDSEGRMAVGGNATLTNFSVASEIAGNDPNRDDLIVGGNLVQTNGKVSYDTRVRGSATLTNVDKSTSVYHVDGAKVSNNGAVFPPGGSGVPPSFFSDAESSLKAESIFLGGLAQTADASKLVQYGQLFLTGSATVKFTVFRVKASELRDLSTIHVVTSVADATVVINVDDDGSGFGITTAGVSFEGAQKIGISRLLYNFYSATNLTISSVTGSVLAPFASVTLNSGGFDGQLVAGSLRGTGETHITKNGATTAFNGTLATPAVPEPTSLALLLVGGLGALALRRGRRAGAAS